MNLVILTHILITAKLSTQIVYQILSLCSHAFTQTKLIDLILWLLFYYRVDLLQPFLLFQLQSLAVLEHDAFIQSFLFFLKLENESLILGKLSRAWFRFRHWFHFYCFFISCWTAIGIYICFFFIVEISVDY